MPAVFQKTVEQDLRKPLKIQYCADTVFTKDNAGNLINVLLYEDGEPYNGGGTVSATAIRADGATESWAGTISGNTVSVALTRAALDVPGTLQVFIKVTAGTTETTVYAGVYNVVCTETPTVVAPVTPSDVAALIASIEDAIRNIPADWTSFLGTIAPTFDPTKADGYAAGAYVWYPGQPDNVGTLYRFTSAHSGTWTGTDAVTVVVGNELNDTVRYTQQTRTDAEKTVARANIGAASNDGLYSLGYQVSVNTTDIDVIQRTIGSGLDPNNTVKSQLDGIKADIGTVPEGQNLQGEVSDLKSALQDISGCGEIALFSGYIATNSETINVNNVVPHSTYYCAAVPCVMGDYFTVNSIGGSTPYAWAFVDGSGNRLLNSGANATATNVVICAPINAAYLVINTSNSALKSFSGVLNKKRAVNSNSGVFNDYSFSIVLTSGNGNRNIPLETIIPKGAFVTITNNNPSNSFSVIFLDAGMNETGDSVSLTKAGTATSSASIICSNDAYWMKTYLVTGCNISITFGQNINKENINNNKGFIQKNNDEYIFVSSQRYKLYSYKLNKGTYNVKTVLPITTETNFVTWVVSKKNNYKKLSPIADSGIISIQTEGVYSYVVSVTHDNCYLIIAQVVSIYSEPYIETIKPLYNYDFFKNAANEAGLSVQNERITRGTNVGFFSINVYNYCALPYIVRAKTGYSDSPVYITINGNNTYNNIRMELYPNIINGCAEVRIPPLNAGLNDYYKITLAFPAGSYVDYIDITEEHTIQRRPTYDGIDVNAHLGFTSLSPENTMPGFVAAYQSGYDAIICNPKLTADGVWVCCHDETINRTARNADGSSISSTITIANTNYNDLLQYDFGIAYNTAFAGTKIPKLEDFLKLCAITGVRPIFSMHQTEGFSTLYPLVKQYGQMNKLVLKVAASDGVLESFYSLFGDIYMYDVVINNPEGILTSLIARIKTTQAYAKCRTMIDVPATYITQAVTEEITGENILCGVYDLQQTLFANYKKFVDWGVTQFTDDRYPVVGLKWL